MFDKEMRNALKEDAKKLEQMGLAKEEPVFIVELCEECGIHYADPPKKICVGCDAYREHTGYF